MNDFIHEQPKEPTETAPPQAAEKTEEYDESTGQKRVYGYIILLFSVVFCLLLWTYLMNQRSTDEVLNELRGSSSSLQYTLERNETLEERIVELEKQNQYLSEQLETLRAQTETLEADMRKKEKDFQEMQLRLLAEDYLRGLEDAVRRNDQANALACMERLEESAQISGEDPVDMPLKNYLPNSTSRKNADGSEAESAAAVYERLKETLTAQ